MPFFYTDSGSFNNLEVTGSTILSGSLIVSGATNFGPSGLTGSLFGSASYADSASYALTASFAQSAVTASYFSGSVSFPDGLTVGQLTASNAQLTNIVDTTATNKILVLNTANNQIFTTASVGGGGSGTGFPFSGSAVITGSLLVSGSSTVTGSNNSILINGEANDSYVVTILNTNEDGGNSVKIKTQAVGAGAQIQDSVIEVNTAIPLRMGTYSDFIDTFVGYGYLLMSGSTTILPQNQGPFYIGNEYISGSVALVAGKFNRSTGEGIKVFISASGNVGIGTNGNSTNRLAISGSVSASSYTSSLNNQVGFFGTSSFAVSSSYATSASYVASASFDGYINFANGLVVTGSVTASIVSASTAVTASSVRVPGRIDVVSPANPASSMSISVGDTAGYASFKTSGDIVYYEFPSTQVVFNAGFIATADVSVRGAIKDDFNSALRITGGTANITHLSSSLIVSSSNNNSPVTISGSTDSFFELEVVNFSAGNNASSDIVVSSNNTTDFGNYIDLGINSTTFNGPLVGGASDGYLYFTSSVGELDIGNASPTANGNVRLFAGGPDSAATTRVFISASGNVGIGTTTNLLNRLTVQGGVSASSVTGSFTGSFTGALTHFNPVALKLTVGTTAPTSPAVNDLWVDTN